MGLMEIMLMLVAPYPYIDHLTIKETYLFYNDDGERYYVAINTKINDVLLFCSMIARLYLIVRFLLSTTPYKNVRSQRLCQIYGVEANYMYSIKAVMKDSPYSFLFLSLLVPMLIGGYALRMFERYLITESG